MRVLNPDDRAVNRCSPLGFMNTLSVLIHRMYGSFAGVSGTSQSQNPRGAPQSGFR